MPSFNKAPDKLEVVVAKDFLESTKMPGALLQAEKVVLFPQTNEKIANVAVELLSEHRAKLDEHRKFSLDEVVRLQVGARGKTTYQLVFSPQVTVEGENIPNVKYVLDVTYSFDLHSIVSNQIKQTLSNHRIAYDQDTIGFLVKRFFYNDDLFFSEEEHCQKVLKAYASTLLAEQETKLTLPPRGSEYDEETRHDIFLQNFAKETKNRPTVDDIRVFKKIAYALYVSLSQPKKAALPSTEMTPEEALLASLEQETALQPEFAQTFGLILKRGQEIGSERYRGRECVIYEPCSMLQKIGRWDFSKGSELTAAELALIESEQQVMLAQFGAQQFQKELNDTVMRYLKNLRGHRTLAIDSVKCDKRMQAFKNNSTGSLGMKRSQTKMDLQEVGEAEHLLTSPEASAAGPSCHENCSGVAKVMSLLGSELSGAFEQAATTMRGAYNDFKANAHTREIKACVDRIVDTARASFKTP